MTPEEIARKLTAAQRTCGDVLDRLPCLRCGATSLRQCTLDLTARGKATDIINRTRGLMNLLLKEQEASASMKEPNHE